MKTHSFDNSAKSSGLTRVDLLTLMAVMALLGVLALPAWSRPGPRSSRIQCLTNLRQIALATIQFANDNGNRLPQSISGSWAKDLPVTTANAMQPYGLTREILYEPGIPGQNNDLLWNFSPQFRVIGYAMTFPGTASLNQTNANGSIDPQPAPIASVWLPAPAAVSRVLWADVTISAPGQNSTNPLTRATYNYSSIQGGAPQPDRTSHLVAGMPAGGNLAMLDGHVEWRQFSDMIPRTTGGSTPVFWW